jgi:hypothetical protein
MQALSQLSYTPGKRRRIILSAIFPVNVQVEIYRPHHPADWPFREELILSPLIILAASPPVRPEFVEGERELRTGLSKGERWWNEFVEHRHLGQSVVKLRHLSVGKVLKLLVHPPQCFLPAQQFQHQVDRWGLRLSCNHDA